MKPTIAIISASYCRGEEIARKLSEKIGGDYIPEETLLQETAKRFGASEEKLKIAAFGVSTLFGMNGVERNLHLSYLKATLLDKIKQGGLVYHGYSSLLIAPEITGVLKVFIVGGSSYRIKAMMESEEVGEKEAKNLISRDDRILLNWTNFLFNLDPSDESLYDMIVPTDKTGVEKAVENVAEQAASPALIRTDKAEKAIEDEILRAKVEIKLFENKHNVEVGVSGDKAEIFVKKYSLFFDKYKKTLSSLAMEVEGVKSAEIKISKKFKTPSIATPVDFDVPRRIMLVDDEREFVETLSERLKTRNYDSTIAYSGEEALEKIENERPEVMILDLKMPGINGLEALRRVKKVHPKTEVIILTGHGSKHEEKTAFDLGAFAYLEKPVDIEVLTSTMKKAYEKANLDK